MILAVTGITGHTGGYFLQELIRNKYDGTLRVLVRKSSNTRALDESGLRVEKIVGDIKNPDDLFRLVNGADRVLHIAGIRDTLPLMEAIDKAGVKGHIVLVHTTGIYSRFRMASGEYKEIEQALRLSENRVFSHEKATRVFGFEPRSSADLIDKAERFLTLTREQREKTGLAGHDKAAREFDREIVIKAYLKEVENA